MVSKHVCPRAWAALAALALSLSCSKDEKAAPPADTAPARSEPVRTEEHATATATLGGQIVAVGDYQAEVAIHADGRVRGLVFDASAAPVPPAYVRDFSVTLSAEGVARPDLKLVWDSNAACFAGQTGADVELVPGDVDVRLEIDARVALLGRPAAAQAELAERTNQRLVLNGVFTVATLLPPLAAHVAAPTLAADARADVAAPQARASLAAKTKAPAPRAKAGAQVKASATVAVPAPKVAVSSKTSAGTKGKPAASVKAKASFGLGK